MISSGTKDINVHKEQHKNNALSRFAGKTFNVESNLSQGIDMPGRKILHTCTYTDSYCHFSP